MFIGLVFISTYYMCVCVSLYYLFTKNIHDCIEKKTQWYFLFFVFFLLILGTIVLILLVETFMTFKAIDLLYR